MATGDGIRVDPGRLGELAAALRAEVERQYVPQLVAVGAELAVDLPPPAAEFRELVGLLGAHRDAQARTVDQVHDYANRSSGLAAAAERAGARYAAADARAAAAFPTGRGSA
ncbi:hypothetical protein GCM10010123_23670 [Pilimelia anulata]|uniref:Uncharacterized protein n=1 Tax=Pilimelia anulata TaxID=53371 RepID=A0A8J3B4K0_9ACTN|nr:hypothetical protein [Pilimelia anulata]GGJ93063.1 hypothetical protein GCM10010123_23670 [Pilimelia anulata]